MGKYIQVTKKTRENLINSFWSLYKDNSVDKITIEKICNNAKYERTTFYRYFKDTSDLLNQLEDEIIDNIITEMKNKDKKTNDIVYNNFKSFTETNGEYIVVFYEKGNVNFYNKFKNLIEENVYKHFNIIVEDTLKKEFLYEFIFSSLINTYVYWYKHQDIISIQLFINFANNLISIGTKSILENAN